jgi:hypothetical protein
MIMIFYKIKIYFYYTKIKKKDGMLFYTYFSVYHNILNCIWYIS